jgi:hypothetical protein
VVHKTVDHEQDKVCEDENHASAREMLSLLVLDEFQGNLSDTGHFIGILLFVVLIIDRDRCSLNRCLIPWFEERDFFFSRRMIFVFTNLVLLMVNSFVDHTYPGNEGNDLIIRSIVITAFVISMILLTWVQVKRIDRVHRDKD